MSKNYFGTDGVRGRVGEPPITPELVLKLGYAAGRVLASESAGKPGETPAVLIGKDTRISGYLLEAALEAGLSAAGVDVYLSGPLPTPAVAYLTRALRLSAGVGAMHPRFLQAAVVEHGADLGLALDGDGDRLIMVDAEGRCYDGDQLLYVIALDYWRRGAMAGGVVGTQMSNLGFEQALGRRGIPLSRAPVGDRYVLEMMLEKRWMLGGENSGHIICLDKHTTGDSIVAALAVLRALREQQMSLADVTADAPLFPQRLINVPIRKGFDWKSNVTIRRAEQEAIAVLDGSGRVLLRPSGTEPVLRVMVEAREAHLADRCAQGIADAVAKAAA